jgi:putative salt-induced outer membrane protein YdiY
MTKIAIPRVKAGTILALGALALLVLGPAIGLGQEASKQGIFGPWQATAEISYVVTGGNTSTSAFSLGTSFTRKWTKDTLQFKGFILNSNSTTVARTAQGTEEDFDILETKTTRKVAESYLLGAQYDRKISKKLAGQAGASWDRNRFAGIDDRAILTAGLGFACINKPRTQLKSSAGLTYTFRRYVGQDWESFGGLRFAVSAEQKVFEASSLSSVFVFDENLKDAPDWRFDWTNSVTATLNKKLALKVSLRTLYTHQPALQEIPLFDLGGLPTGLNVSIPLKNLDMFFTTSIVINF